MAPRRRILVVDDATDYREALRIRLTHEGFDVTAVGSGREGLAVAARQPVDLILLDMLMPDKDGITTYQELKANPTTRQIPLILLTGLAVEGHWEPMPYESDGPAFVMGKPYDHAVLLERIAQLLAWNARMKRDEGDDLGGGGEGRALL